MSAYISTSFEVKNRSSGDGIFNDRLVGTDKSKVLNGAVEFVLDKFASSFWGFTIRRSIKLLASSN